LDASAFRKNAAGDQSADARLESIRGRNESGAIRCFTASAGSGAEIYGTTAQIANAAGVAATGAAFWPSKPPSSARLALFASLGACLRARLPSVTHFCRGRGAWLG